MLQSNTKTGVKLSDVKLNLTKLQSLSAQEQTAVKGGCASCNGDLRRCTAI
jgi:hypothetical protein